MDYQEESLLTKAEQGDVDAQFRLGLMYDLGRDYVEAARLWRLAAAQGYASAQYNLGFMYDHGLGVAQDNVEAARWYRLAAKQDEQEEAQ
jgi:TPR repeat protein